MNLAYLKTFVAVVQYQSISRAAVELHLSQPAVTKHVQALEAHYGRPLLLRLGPEVRVTEEGMILYRHSLEVLRILAQAEADLAEVGETVRGLLQLGASTIPGQYVLPHVISSFRHAYPQIDLQLEIGNTEAIARKVAENKVDVGVVGSPVRDRRLASFPFLEDELVVAIPANHPLAVREKICARDLAGQPLIWRKAGSGTRKTVEDKLAKAGIDLNLGQRVLEVGSTEAAVAAVEAGVGLSIVSRWAVLKSVRLGTVVTKSLADVNLKRQLYVIYPRHGTSRTGRAFVDFLQGAELQQILGRVLSLKENKPQS